MAMLHMVNKSPFEKSTLASCLQHAQEGSSILLLEDGIYAALQGSAVAEDLKKAMTNKKIYALAPDLEARGVSGRVMDGVELVDYAGFVELVANHENNQSWL